MIVSVRYNSATRHRSTVVSGPPQPLRIASPAPREAWTATWQASTQATIFHRPEWLEACCATGDFQDVSRLYETADGERIVLPLVRSRASRPAWPTTWSMPVGWGLGGAFGSRPLDAGHVAMVLEDLLRDDAQLVISPGPVTADAWAGAPAQARVRHDAHVVDVRAGFGALWSKVFSSDTRNKVRKAQKRGVEVQWGRGSELLRLYWDVYLRWIEQLAGRRGIPGVLAVALAKHREPLTRYEAIAEYLGERCQVAVARVDGEPAASVIALLDGVHGHYWRASSDQALVHRRYANHLLLAHTLERAAASGCHYVHLGESGGKASLIQFKEHFGGRPVSYEELRFGPLAMTGAMRAREKLTHAAESLAVRGAATLTRARAR
ncbi:MAG: GNAT family N-acetyltransferase [Solirubrobacterales bacterium]|nr:GNAT family N-acetyltransferase [Solirubrobacterales bacterium]